MKLSIAAKNALSYFVLFLITIGLTGFMILRSSSKEIVEASKKNLIHTTQQVDLQFANYIEEFIYDIRHIGQSPLLELYFSDSVEFNRILLENEYLSLLYSKPHFSQIRIIGLENDGKEIVRVERSGSQCIIVDRNQLQVKSDREYFINSINLAPQSIYISPIDLNKEYGKISRPHTPTIRMSYPYFKNGVLVAIVVINADVSSLLDDLSSLADEFTNVSILDDQGYYIADKDTSMLFEFEFGKSSSFKDKFGVLPENMVDSPDQVQQKGELLYDVQKLYYPKADYEVYAFVSADRDHLLSGFYKWRNNSLIIIFSFAILSLILAMGIMRRQVREIKLIAHTIDKFSHSLDKIQIPAHRNDELGLLAKSFNYMSSMVLENIKSLEQSKKMAENAVKEKTEFLENMSHEIRNPLHSIIGLSDLLYNNKHFPHQEKLIESIRLNTMNLQGLVNNVLDYRKALREEIVLDSAWFELDQFLNDFLKLFIYSASLKKIELKLEGDLIGKRVSIFSDALRLGQLLSNLVSNAVKFTPNNGKIVIVAEGQDISESEMIVSVKVIDNGIGISDKQRMLISERYYTGDENVVPNDSFGIGLSIVIALLKLFNSQLNIDANPEGGSCFSFSIKAPYRHSGSSELADIIYDNSVLEDKTILIIEDDVMILDLYKHQFTGLFKQINYVKSIHELIEVKTKKYDIVISDFRLSDASIGSFDDQLKGLTDDNTIFYLISAIPQSEISGLSFNYNYLQKPFSAKELISEIIKKVNTNNFGIPDFSSIIEDYDGDLSKVKEVLLLLKTDWLEMEKNGAICLEQKNQTSLNAIVHKIITSVRRLGLTNFEDFLVNISSDVNEVNDDKISEYRQRMKFYIASIDKYITSIT